MGEQINFPDVPTWQRFRAEIEPYLSSSQINAVSDIESIIQNYDKPTVLYSSFEQLLVSLGLINIVNQLTSQLVDALNFAQPSLINTDQQAKNILFAWLPYQLSNFSVHTLYFRRVAHQDKEEAYLLKNVMLSERLKNWVEFPALDEWHELQNRLRPYRNHPSDQLLIQWIDQAEESYLELTKFISYIESICTWIVAAESIQYLLTGKIMEDGRFESALKAEQSQLWIELRLKIWMKNTISKFEPTGDTATISLINRVYKYLHYRISKDLLPNYWYGTIPNEYSLDSPTYNTEDDDNDIPLIDKLDQYMMPSSESLDHMIVALQENDKVLRGFSGLQNFVNVIVNSLEAIHQSWEYRLANYIEQDPHHELQNKFYAESSCNYQYLAKMLLLPKLKGLALTSVEDICRNFPSIAAGLKTHIYRKFYPWIDSIYLEILTKQEWCDYKNYLEHIAVEDLTQSHRKSFPTCNIFFLALKRLPCYISDPLDWNTLAEIISDKDSKKIKPAYVEKFWDLECRPKLGKISRQILEYPID